MEWFQGDREGWGIRLATQFTHQRSVGDDRLTGESFETWVWGGKVAASWKEAVLTVAVSVTDDQERVRNPWGSYPGYLAMMQRNFNDAGEKAWDLGASFYFGLIGVPDLSLALRYSEGYDRRAPVASSSPWRSPRAQRHRRLPAAPGTPPRFLAARPLRVGARRGHTA